MPTTPAPASEIPASIADHPVLDMLNTVTSVDGRPHDVWQTDQDVAAWLVHAGWVDEPLADRY
ncbi:ABATE domain-containing protein, partial [Ralstonia solanacearum]